MSYFWLWFWRPVAEFLGAVTTGLVVFVVVALIIWALERLGK